MSKKLTREQWLTVSPPLYWLKFDKFSDKTPIFIELVEKWLNSSVEGWWHRDCDIFVFSTKEDRATFKMWILSGVFDGKDYGDVEVTNNC